MTSDNRIPQLTNYLRNEFSATKIYLFGSRAKGTSRSDSDYDFVVVSTRNDIDKWQAYEKASKDIFETYGVQADVWVYSGTAFDELVKDFGSLPETAVNTGIEV